MTAAKRARRAGVLNVSRPSNPTSQIGPTINERAVEKIERHVREPASQGARIWSVANASANRAPLKRRSSLR